MPDGGQLPLPAAWARGYGIISSEHPVDQRRRLERDVLDAKAAIRLVLDALAEKHGVPVKEVAGAMNYVDDALADLVYEVMRELDAEEERRSSIE